MVLKNSDAEKRDAFRNKLHKKGIQTSVHYPAIHRFSAYKEFTKKLPNTEYATDNEITLPMYARLREKDVEYICDAVEDCCKLL